MHQFTSRFAGGPLLTRQLPFHLGPKRLVPLGGKISASLGPKGHPTLGFEDAFAILLSIVSPDALVEAAATPLGRGLVPPKDVPAGTPLISVDWVNLLVVTDHPERDRDEFSRRVLGDWQQLHGPLPPALSEFILSARATWAVRLAAWLLWLRLHGTGVWRLYIQTLPQESDMTCLMNFTDEEAFELQDHELRAMVRSERGQLAALRTSVFGCGPPSSTSPSAKCATPTTPASTINNTATSSALLSGIRSLRLAPKLEDILWAFSMVNSRCFSDTVKGEVVSMMVPCADFANHSSTSPGAEYMYNNGADAFQLVALRDLEPGREMCISYGCLHKDNAALMRDYGFILEANLCDRVNFDDCIGHSSSNSGGAATPSLHAGRFIRSLGVEGAIDPGSGTFKLKGSSSPEVLLAMEGAKGVDARRKVVTFLSLGPFFRQLPRDTSPGSGVGGDDIAPMDEEEARGERQSAADLREICLTRLAGMPTSIEMDEGLLSGGLQSLGPRRHAAIVARLEIKRKFAAAADFLQAYSHAI